MITPEEFLATLTEMVERQQSLLTLLYLTAERTNRQTEAFYSLRKLNDYAYEIGVGMLHASSPDPEDALMDYARFNEAITLEIARLDPAAMTE